MASEPRVPPEDQNQREGEGERGRQRESERAREGEMLQSIVFSHKIQWSRSQFRSQACPEDRGGTQLIEQKCRVIAEQHRESSFKKPSKIQIFIGFCIGAITFLLLRRTSDFPRSAWRDQKEIKTQISAFYTSILLPLYY